MSFAAWDADLRQVTAGKWTISAVCREWHCAYYRCELMKSSDDSRFLGRNSLFLTFLPEKCTNYFWSLCFCFDCRWGFECCESIDYDGTFSFSFVLGEGSRDLEADEICICFDVML